MKDTESKTAPAKKPLRISSLRRKVFLPFFLLIILLSATAILSAIHLAGQSYENSTDQRLAAAQEILYREFKKQEIILQTYAVLLQHFQSLTKHIQDAAEIGILHDRLFQTLDESDISTAFYPADIRDLIQQEDLADLFDQVRRSEKVRFRYTSSLGSPMLVVAAPIMEKGNINQILMLQSALGDAFLRSIASSLNVEATLMTIDGEVLAQSRRDNLKLALTPAQITTLSSGTPLILNCDVSTGPERHLYTTIPLGSSDMVLLSVQASLQKATDRQRNAVLQMIVIIVAVIVIGTIIYFRKISAIVRPAKELRIAADAISQGSLNYRILEITDDELGQISMSFNHMAQELENNYHQRANQDIAEALAKEELKTRATLEYKEREKIRANEELSILQREISALYQLNQAMTTSANLNGLFDRIIQVMNDILTCDHVVLLEYNYGDSMLEVARVSGMDAEALSSIRFNLTQGITGEAAKTQQMIYVEDLDKDKRHLSYHGQFVTRGSMISAPLVIKGRLVGILNLHKKKIDAFSKSEIKLVQAVANQAAIAIDNAQLLEKSRNLNNTDELTGLANRRYFQDTLKREVAQARRFNSVFAIIMCDIDDFKSLASSLGRMHADALLRLTGKLLLKNTRGIDLVSRFGNDQFIILLPKTDKAGAISAAEKLRVQIQSEDFAVEMGSDKAVSIAMSFGVTEFPGDSRNIYELLNLADRSLYAAKQDGGNCTVGWEGPAVMTE